MSTTDEDEQAQPCAAEVEYKDRQGVCQRKGKYQDADGERWWCGLHNPDRKPKVRLAPPETEPASAVDREVLLRARHPDIEELLSALENARAALFEISNVRAIGWPDNTPIEKYKIIMTHMADRANEASAAASEAIYRFRS